MLAVQEEAEDGAEKVLDAIARNGLDNVAFNFLGPKVRERPGEGVAEAIPKHDDELVAAARNRG